MAIANSDYFQNSNIAVNEDNQRYWQKILSIFKKENDRDKRGFIISKERLQMLAFDDKYNLENELKKMEEKGLVKIIGAKVILTGNAKDT
jgi:hypothetical protein